MTVQLQQAKDVLDAANVSPAARTALLSSLLDYLTSKTSSFTPSIPSPEVSPWTTVFDILGTSLGDFLAEDVIELQMTRKELKLLQVACKDEGLGSVTEESYPVADETIEVIAEDLDHSASQPLDSGPSFGSFSEFIIDSVSDENDPQ
jgi:hypothetical protein